MSENTTKEENLVSWKCGVCGTGMNAVSKEALDSAKCGSCGVNACAGCMDDAAYDLAMVTTNFSRVLICKPFCKKCGVKNARNTAVLTMNRVELGTLIGLAFSGKDALGRKISPHLIHRMIETYKGIA